MAKSMLISDVQTHVFSHWKAYYEMTKPKVVALMLLTVLVGMSLSVNSAPTLQPLILGLLGIGLMAAAAAVLNHIIDRRIDAVMTRTHNRPLPRGEISTFNALFFSIILMFLGFVTLFFGVNPLTAWLTTITLIGYAIVYTGYLKRATPQNIVIGGLTGAMPPLLGWTAITGEFHSHALFLVMIIFIWTPPHFWALAIYRQKEYAKVNIPMLPVTHGIEYTKTCIFLYSVLLAVVCLLPVIIGMCGIIYLISSSILSCMFIYKAWVLKFSDDIKLAMQLFKFSIIYLMLLFVALLVDHYMVL